MPNHEQLEEQMSDALTEGEMSLADPQNAAPKLLSPKWEIRIPAKQDPIALETRRYREIAQEADDRYDAYMAHSETVSGETDNTGSTGNNQE